MRTAHRLLDCSDFGGQFIVCDCEHFRWTAPWKADRSEGEALWHEHLRLWAEAELELDEVEAR